MHSTPHRHRLVSPSSAAFLLLAGVVPGAAQVTLGGQLRPRVELRDPLAGELEVFTTMRTRLHLASRPTPTTGVFVQLQDVRFWGEERGTLADFDADGLDVHQAWIELGTEGASTLWIRTGRQETVLGGERLVGAVDWTQQGRAFDGIRAAALVADLRVDVFLYQLAEEASATAGDDARFLGAYGVVDAGGGQSLDLYLLHDRSETATTMRRTTLGLRWVGDRGPWSYRGEASWQTGRAGEGDLGAWMAGARVGRTFYRGRSGVTLWYDHLSGDDDTGDAEASAFHTLFATNHRFYGFADLFLDVPTATRERGLGDLAVKGWADVGPEVRVSADLHHFRVPADRGLSTSRLGEELDLTGRWLWEGLTFTTGLSYVVQGDGMAEVGLLDEDMVWAYVMVSAVF